MRIFTKILKVDTGFNVQEYIKAHQPEFMWPETVKALHEVGVLDMELYLQDSMIIMTMITVDDFDHDFAMNKLATLPKQKEWEAYVAKFQGVNTEQSAKDKWNLIPPIYSFKKCLKYFEKKD